MVQKYKPFLIGVLGLTLLVGLANTIRSALGQNGERPLRQAIQIAEDPLLKIANATRSSAEQNIVFPPNTVINVAEAPYNARGNDKVDDTKVLQQAIYDSMERSGVKGRKLVYVPNGTYYLSRPLILTRKTWSPATGPFLIGQNRDRVIFKLKDNLPEFADPKQPQAALQTLHQTKAQDSISADYFFRILWNFTVDTGNNPGAHGIRYYSNNVGTLKNVKLLGNGKGYVGVDLGWIDQNGPLLLRDILIDGFQTGLAADKTINSQTISGITIRNSRKHAIWHQRQVLSIEDLVVENAPVAIASAGGPISVISGRFVGTDRSKAAIQSNGSSVYLRDIKSSGFKALVEQKGAISVSTANVDEYASSPVRKLFEASQSKSIGLPIKKAPVVPWETNRAKWVSANQFGATLRDNNDDAKAVQAAIDSAARSGKTTVYLEPATGTEPNWYHFKRDVRIHGSVRRIIGLGKTRIFGGSSKAANFPLNLNGFVVDPSVKAPVIVQNLLGLAPGQSLRVENRSLSAPLVVESSTVAIVASNATETFAEDCGCTVFIRHPNAQVWARQLNPESKTMNTDNQSGSLWILGLKTEGNGINNRTTDGGRTEIFGGHIYSGNVPNSPPMFEAIDSQVTLVNQREINYAGGGHNVGVSETRNGATKTLLKDAWTMFSATQSPAKVAPKSSTSQPISQPKSQRQ
jgi:hypothetical protein